jgi:hypothetical protein
VSEHVVHRLHHLRLQLLELVDAVPAQHLLEVLDVGEVSGGEMVFPLHLLHRTTSISQATKRKEEKMTVTLDLGASKSRLVVNELSYTCSLPISNPPRKTFAQKQHFTIQMINLISRKSSAEIMKFDPGIDIRAIKLCVSTFANSSSKLSMSRC